MNCEGVCGNTTGAEASCKRNEGTSTTDHNVIPPVNQPHLKEWTEITVHSCHLKFSYKDSETSCKICNEGYSRPTYYECWCSQTVKELRRTCHEWDNSCKNEVLSTLEQGPFCRG